jgi:hypothetical protein
MWRSLRLSGSLAVILVVSQTSGCQEREEIVQRRDLARLAMRNVSTLSLAGQEVIVRRQELAPLAGRDESLSEFVQISFLILMATAAALASIETLTLQVKDLRKAKRTELAIQSIAQFGSRLRTPKQRTQITEPGKRERDQWLARVAGMTAHRKLRCMNSCGRTAMNIQCPRI